VYLSIIGKNDINTPELKLTIIGMIASPNTKHVGVRNLFVGINLKNECIWFFGEEIMYPKTEIEKYINSDKSRNSDIWVLSNGLSPKSKTKVVTRAE